ncbi:helix-turn-helix domain-containing protein [Methylobacterium soli]|uniref:Uncharacterized protein n=1 Tax=Methylobacterium soli TaxID=553447 RepID=A0A6L3SSU6_9HYPH|nr:helix-turn-helix domain-containing protein [Methylobacterium soli]KAB1076528.1 hypothetical protein F6X53_22760 [Methylobacterium soli]GJE44833.1 hypothetical protein AEGHOMDF_4024 [Methylobacterium soli]
MKRTRTAFERRDIELAIRLRSEGVTWADIAARLGRTRSSIEATVCRYRKGLWAPQREALQQRDAEMERLAEAGAPLRAICAAAGLKTDAARRRLRNLGLDHEVRRNLARARTLAALGRPASPTTTPADQKEGRVA